MKRNYQATCRKCGSKDITKDAIVRWDEWHQIWELSAIYDSGDCHECCANGNNLVEWIEDDNEGETE